jgi:uroporphyrinogen-III synthase
MSSDDQGTPGGRPGVLIFRPEPGAAETADRAAAMGWQPILSPALVLVPRSVALPRVQAVLITSRAAARALPEPLPGLPLLAVGEATAREARARGWRDARAAGGTASDLAALAARLLDPRRGPLLLAAGEGYALDLAAELRRHGFRVLRRVAYAAAPAMQLSREACVALAGGRVGAALFHSPRSARCAMTLIRQAGLAEAVARAEALAVSHRVAAAAVAALAPLRWQAVRIAERPDEAALLALLGEAGRMG